MKAVVAQYNAEQLLTEREKVSQRISELLEERAEKYHIKLDDVSITHLAFGRDFNNAIEQKQVALQRAEKAKFVVARAEQEKIVRIMNEDYEQAAIIEAEGEAEAATLISDALKESGPGVIEVRRIDVSRMMIN